jgi:hypothetical protein
LFKEIIDLEEKCFIQDGKIDDERFRSLRLARAFTVSVKKAYK